MKYKADLYKIPMSVFVEIYTNPDNDIEFDIDKAEAVANLVESYTVIVGGVGLKSFLINENRILDNSNKIEVMNACENLMILGQYEAVSEVLSDYGFNVSKDDKEGLKQRIATIKSRSTYDFDMAMKSKEESRKNQKATAKEDFIKEQVFLMRYNKLHIDMDKFTAAEYAYLVKQTTEELQNIKRQKNKSMM